MKTQTKSAKSPPAGRPRSTRAPAARVAVEAPARTETADRPGGVQSIARAFSILEEIARNRDGIGLADLSKRVGLHNSTAFHLVRTMVSLGYLRQLPDSKRYRVGRPLFALAASALDENEMVSLATPILEDLSRLTGESSHFAVQMGDSAVVIASTAGPSAFQLSNRVGIVRPAYATAIGKVLLAALRQEQLDRYLERAEMPALTDKTIVDAQRLRQEIDVVRSSGIAFDDGEFDSEVRCAAVPVRDFTGQVLGAIGISGPVWRLSLQSLQSRIQQVQAASYNLSVEFGASPQERGKP